MTPIDIRIDLDPEMLERLDDREQARYVRRRLAEEMAKRCPNPCVQKDRCPSAVARAILKEMDEEDRKEKEGT